MKPGVAIALLACALFAGAQPGFVLTASAQVQRTSEYLSKMDADGDGRVSLAEYQDWMSYAFDAMDRNHDGVLTPDEQPGSRGKPVSRSEHRTRLAERFRKQDLNHDGFLSARELAAPPQ
ncbi:MAG: EF-hand domain-containing protein [Thermomonas sp.]